jgi:small subunit ribosomal protein S6
MFLVDSAQAGSDWDGIISAIRKILEKAQAEIVSMNKWDDRKLAYDIKGTSRGTYILTYFRVDGGRISEIEKSVQLSERIIRVLILNAERLSQEDIERETPAMKLEKEQEENQESQERAKEGPPEPVSTGEGPKEAEKSGAPSEATAETQAGEAEKLGESEQQEENMNNSPEEVREYLEASEANPASDMSPVAQDNLEKQPEQKQPEEAEQPDKNELL